MDVLQFTVHDWTKEIANKIFGEFIFLIINISGDVVYYIVVLILIYLTG